MTVWILHVKIAFPPGSIPRSIWLKSFLFEMSPECIHICDVKYYSAPASTRAALLQVDDRKLSIWNAQRRETYIRPTVEEFHSQHLAIEPQGSFQMGDLQSDCGNLFNSRFHSGSSYRA